MRCASVTLQKEVIRKIGRTWIIVKTEMQFGRVDRPAETVDFVLAFWPHSDLLAKMPTVSARPVYYSTAGLLDRRVNRPASKPGQNIHK